MVVHSKLIIGAGIAVAGLGLISAGAGATFTAQVGTNTIVTSGGLGLSLNGKAGSDLQMGLDATDLGPHFKPISTDLLLKNTGTLRMVSNFLDVSVPDCDGGVGAVLAQNLHVSLTDVTDNKPVYDGALCSLVSSVGDGAVASASQQGFILPRAHANVGGELPRALGAGKSILYRFVLEPGDTTAGLPSTAQNTSTSVTLAFTGFDY